DMGEEQKSNSSVEAVIKSSKEQYRAEWEGHKNDERVNPLHFFESLRKELDPDAIVVVDDGNHTFLAAELFPVLDPDGFICPSDFNCMGYAVPAAIGAKISNPEKQVTAIVGDGAFTMTCMEILTATRNELGVVFCVFNDGELSQIAQAQQIPYNRKPCTVLGFMNLKGVAEATGADYLLMDKQSDPLVVMEQAQNKAKEGQAVIVDVQIDYSKKTAFTKGTVKTNFKRLPAATKARFLGRSLLRHVGG
ncbi:MAG: thiamine pyrophosphate-dependent enzyme, partial [Sneathiellales bacterium]|nr:thiamine pyrophosphate-dependent enzyme [Sneathiellales bacterium]